MTTLNPETLAELRRLHEASTPSPWKSRGMGGDSYLMSKTHRWHRATYAGYEFPHPLAIPREYAEGDGKRHIDYTCASFAHDDARLIAAMRNAIPEIKRNWGHLTAVQTVLAEFDRLRAENNEQAEATTRMVVIGGRLRTLLSEIDAQAVALPNKPSESVVPTALIDQIDAALRASGLQAKENGHAD